MIEVGAPERAAAAPLTLGTGAGAGGAVKVADGDAFASWYRTEHPRLLATMTIVTRDLHTAQDITAEAFARALAAWHRVSGMDSPTGWTYRVALNLARRRARRSALEERLLRRIAPAPSDVQGDAFPTEHAIDLWDAVRALPPRAREAIALRYTAGLSEAEVAAAMKVAVVRPPRPSLPRAARWRPHSPTLQKENDAMDDFDSRLEDELARFGRTPLAEPAALADLHRRARRVRVGRAVTGVVATATAIALIVGGLAVVGHDRRRDMRVQVSAPNFVLGDVDAVVLSSRLDPDGARAPIPPDLVARVAAVPGVQSVSGVLDTFAPVMDAQGAALPLVPPRTAILFSYHKDDDVNIVDGRKPAADNEIAVDADFLTRNDKDVGDSIDLTVRNESRGYHIVGTLDLPGVDLTGIPLVAMSAAHQTTELQVDRIDVNLKPGVSPANVRDRVAGALGADYTVVRPSTISFADQRLAQVEIQHAYWALLSSDANERSTSGVGASNSHEKENYAKYSDLAKHVELRVENVAFLSPDAAALTFRIYYGGSPSPIITDPQTGAASRVKGHWQLATSTLCSLAALVGIKCEGEAANIPITPPNGYAPPRTLDPEIGNVFTVLTDPHATVDERVAVVDNGERLRDLVATGAEHDRAIEKSDLTIAGWRRLSDDQVQILYSLQTTGGPSTPWPSNAVANKGTDGRWRAAPEYACGIQGVASGGCYTAEGQPAAGRTPVTAEVVPARP